MNIHHVTLKDQVLTESIEHLVKYATILETELMQIRTLINSLMNCMSEADRNSANVPMNELIRRLQEKESVDGSASSPLSENPSDDRKG